MTQSPKQKIALDSNRYQPYCYSIMVTPRAVTKHHRFKSDREATDSQPVPKWGPTPPRAVRLKLISGDAEGIVEWLNAATGTASCDRVVWIYQELKDLPAEFDKHRDAYMHVGRGPWPEEKAQITQRLNGRLTALAKALEKYIFRPRATMLLYDNWAFGMVPDQNSRCFTIERDGFRTYSEADAVLSLIRLGQTGDLGKIRLCEMCKKRWRFAAKKNYRFCSDQCREDFYAKSPDYHNRKAANQKKYRDREKLKDAAKPGSWKRL
jgi:hypothetical protein